jgi:diadenylate cyclase
MNFWNSFNWVYLSVFLDILVVSFVIYRILLLLRGTRALPMLFGLGIIISVYIVSKWLSLVSLHWILDNFLGSLIIVIVVLFQDDLRRGLIKVGLGPGLGMPVVHAVEQSITEVSRAASELASRRLGAIIVIKRTIGLEDYTEHAVQLNAQVSHQLLTSIFLRTSPLHDGAVIIEGNIIRVAGAVLPLTFNPTLSSQLGTRHRAAIGLSERTDAVIVVVSEETGTISLIREGRATRDLDEKSLHNALHRLTVYKKQIARERAKRKIINKLLRRKFSKKSKSEDTKLEQTGETG